MQALVAHCPLDLKTKLSKLTCTAWDHHELECQHVWQGIQTPA